MLTAADPLPKSQGRSLRIAPLPIIASGGNPI